VSEIKAKQLIPDENAGGSNYLSHRGDQITGEIRGLSQQVVTKCNGGSSYG
jgi:hypothetical protein